MFVSQSLAALGRIAAPFPRKVSHGVRVGIAMRERGERERGREREGEREGERGRGFREGTAHFSTERTFFCAHNFYHNHFMAFVSE